MVFLKIALAGLLTLAGGARWASFEIQYGDHAQGFWGRYVLSDGTTIAAGWTAAQNGKASDLIDRIPAGSATRLRAIFYAPGCALQTVDIALKKPRLYRYSFPCEPLPPIEIHATLSPADASFAHGLEFEAKYVARWAPAFFENEDGTLTAIPLGGAARLNEDARFQLSVPDLTKDKIAASTDHPGEIQVWARDLKNGQMATRIRLRAEGPGIPTTRFGGIPVAALGAPPPLNFIACAVDPPGVHDRYGFSVRSKAKDADDACRTSLTAAAAAPPFSKRRRWSR